MNPNILGVIGLGFLNQVPTLHVFWLFYSRDQIEASAPVYGLCPFIHTWGFVSNSK